MDSHPNSNTNGYQRQLSAFIDYTSLAGLAFGSIRPQQRNGAGNA